MLLFKQMSLPSYLLKLPFRLKDFPEFGRDDLAKLTVAQLKDMLKEKGLKAGTGTAKTITDLPRVVPVVPRIDGDL